MQSIEERVANLETKVAQLLGQPKPCKALPSMPVGMSPLDVQRAITFIREAGAKGCRAEALRNHLYPMRRAIRDGNPLPKELADHGVIRERRRQGWWYYIPDFL